MRRAMIGVLMLAAIGCGGASPSEEAGAKAEDEAGRRGYLKLKATTDLGEAKQAEEKGDVRTAIGKCETVLYDLKSHREIPQYDEAAAMLARLKAIEE